MSTNTLEVMAEIKEFSVGDKVWWATCINSYVSKPCPVCFGKCVVTVILGNDEHVQTPCGYCAGGFEPPKGYTMEYEWKSGAKEIVLTAKYVNETNGERHVEYRYGSYILRPDIIFMNKEDADKRVLELVAELESEEKNRLEYKKDHTTKSYAWHVGYHKKSAKEARRSLEYHEKKAITMKALARSIPANQ